MPVELDARIVAKGLARTGLALEAKGVVRDAPPGGLRVCERSSRPGARSVTRRGSCVLRLF
jgi:hypothetical protein